MMMVTPFMTEKSVVYPLADAEKMASVGQEKPVELHVLSIEKVDKSVGERLEICSYKMFFQVRGCTPARIYKFIPISALKSGDEVRISQIAGVIGAAPAFYSAFVVQLEREYVVIEMDDAGKCMGQYLEDFAEPEEPQVPEKPSLAAMLQSEAKKSKYKTVATHNRREVSLEVGIGKLFDTQEQFYFELFSKIRLLADHKIAYHDAHLGNIMHVLGQKRVLLIDFDDAVFMESPNAARMDSIRDSAYVQALWLEFAKLPNKSEASIALLKMFSIV